MRFIFSGKISKKTGSENETLSLPVTIHISFPAFSRVSMTLHRAFDMCRDPHSALEKAKPPAAAGAPMDTSGLR